MVDQVWGDEAFADGATPYGASPNLYLKLEPWSTSPEVTTGYGLRVCRGDMYDAFQDALNQTEGVCGPSRITGSAGDGVWVVERQNELADCDVTFAPALYPITGTPDNDTFRQFGVCSHVSGGTLVTPPGSAGTRNEYHSDVNGYFLIEEKEAATAHRVLLLELNAGVITVLGDELVSDTDPAHAPGDPGTFYRPTQLRLNVQDTGATRTVRCYRTTLGGAETLLFGTAFNRPALPDGRCGFGLQSRRTTTGGCDAVGVCNRFTIRNQANSALYFNDRFQRTSGLSGVLRTDTSLQGRSLTSAWTGDASSKSDFGYFNAVLTRDTGGTNTALTGANIAAVSEWVGYMLRQNPATDREQHIETTTTRLNVDLATVTEQGLLLRFTVVADSQGRAELRARAAPSGQTIGRNRRGYAVYVSRDAGRTPVFELQIRHHDGRPDVGYSGDILARADLTTAGLVAGTPFTLRVEVRNFDGNQLGQGTFVAIITKINGATITPVAESIQGVVEQDDFLVDTRSTATTTAGTVGLYANQDLLATNDLVSFADLSTLPLTDPPIIGPDEQATVPVSSEAAAVSGTLAIPLDAVIREEVRRGYIRHEFESGKEQVITAQPQARRIWNVSARMKPTEWGALTALFASNSTVTPFNWVHPYTGVSYIGLFESDELSLTENGSSKFGYDASFTIVELFSATTFNPEL